MQELNNIIRVKKMDTSPKVERSKKMEKVIEVKNLTKDYGQGRGVFDVSFYVNKGEVFGFLGPNGAGKSTTIRHLMGFSVPDSGETYINGHSSLYKRNITMRNVSYIPGEVALPLNLTGQEVIDEQEDKSQSVENILLVAIPNTLVSMIDDEYQLSEDNLNALSSYIYNAFNEVYEEDKNSDNVSIEYTFKLLPLLADSNSEALINQITNSLMEAYLLDSEAYINDENIKKTIIINKAASYIVDVVSETAFYKYLPNLLLIIKHLF